MTDKYIEIFYSLILIPFVLSKVPQIITLFKTKSSANISVIQYFAITLCSAISVFYGIYKDSPSIILANFLNTVIGSIITVQYYLYRPVKALNKDDDF